jgi:hypothetical protein
MSVSFMYFKYLFHHSLQEEAMWYPNTRINLPVLFQCESIDYSQGHCYGLYVPRMVHVLEV